MGGGLDALTYTSAVLDRDLEIIGQMPNFFLAESG